MGYVSFVEGLPNCSGPSDGSKAGTFVGTLFVVFGLWLFAALVYQRVYLHMEVVHWIYASAGMWILVGGSFLSRCMTFPIVQYAEEPV